MLRCTWQLPILASPKLSCCAADCDPNIFAPNDQIILLFSIVKEEYKISVGGVKYTGNVLLQRVLHGLCY